tara:strand:- start:118 stop:339 length:222 start_codon:yes stop_codon:yes gene_type:complete
VNFVGIRSPVLKAGDENSMSPNLDSFGSKSSVLGSAESQPDIIENKINKLIDFSINPTVLSVHPLKKKKSSNN